MILKIYCIIKFNFVNSNIDIIYLTSKIIKNY